MMPRIPCDNRWTGFPQRQRTDDVPAQTAAGVRADGVLVGGGGGVPGGGSDTAGFGEMGGLAHRGAAEKRYGRSRPLRDRRSQVPEERTLRVRACEPPL